MRRFLFIIVSILFLISSISFVFGDTGGCCFDLNTGDCLYNSAQIPCIDFGGEFTPNDAYCVNVDECTKGCCDLGLVYKYETGKSCQIDSGADFDFPNNFYFGMSESDCTTLAQSQTYGACLYSIGMGLNSCEYVTGQSCGSGNFFPDKYCSEIENSGCASSPDTACIRGDVYKLDTCGEPAGIKARCGYERGTICRQVTAKTASCVSVNCKDPITGETRGHGETWCAFDSLVYEDAFSDIIYQNLSVGDIGDEVCAEATENKTKCSFIEMKPKTGTKWRIDFLFDSYNCSEAIASDKAVTRDYRAVCNVLPVGSRFGVYTCLDGEVDYTGCADYRQGYCAQGQCVRNSWDICLAEEDEEDCDIEYCYWLDISNFTNVYGYGDPDFDRRSEVSVSQGEARIKADSNCMPKIPGGFGFWPASGEDTQSDEYCSKGDLDLNARYHASYDYPAAIDVFGSTDREYYCENTVDCIYFDEALWKGRDGKHVEDVTSDYIRLWKNSWKRGDVDDSGLDLINFLNKRCAALGDCDGNLNWIGINGTAGGPMKWQLPDPESTSGLRSYTGELNDTPYIKWIRVDIDSPGWFSGGSNEFYWDVILDFECEGWGAPYSDDNCELCQEEDVDCTIYSCMALGELCEWSIPTGVAEGDGFCVSKHDLSRPEITWAAVIPNPIPPLASAEVIVTTNEMAFCRFNIGKGNAGPNYESMIYPFSSEWGTTHRIRLHPPNKIYGRELNVLDYEFLERDGPYELYVRCIDAADNPMVAAKPIRFSVMETPDYGAPQIYSDTFDPASGSRIKFNTTSKEISFLVYDASGTSECRWSTENELYDEMPNNFGCSTSIINRNGRHGYECTGILDGITTNVTEQSTFYIKCKDQPNLEENNPAPNIYRRNVMEESEEYILKASEELLITELSPQGNIVRKATDTAIQFRAVTSGGGASGIAICDWRLVGEGFGGLTQFINTNSRIHTQITSPLSEGEYNLYVTCRDIYENTVQNSTNFSLEIDRRDPDIIRTYKSGGSLKVVTDEAAVCKYVKDPSVRCTFDWDYANATTMSGVSLEHATPWIADTVYYIRCKDFYDNANKGCGIIVRTY